MHEPGRTEWPGFHYDGRTAHREPVTVTVTAAGLHLARADGQHMTWPYGAIRQTQGRNRGEQVRLEYGDDPAESVVVSEAGLVEAIRDLAPRFASTFHDAAEWWHVAAWIAAGLTAVAALYFWAVPAFAAFVAPRIPMAWEQRVGESVLARMAPAEARCEGQPQIAALRGVLNRIVAAAPSTSYDFTLVVVDDSLVNAFAAPGGYVVVFRGLLEAAETPEELAGVLAHEIEHVLLRHPTQALAREIPLRLALAAVTGGSDGMDRVVQAAGTIGAMRYRRSDEFEADREGMRLIQAARIDPAGMVSFMRTLDRRRAGGPRLVSYLSTHPHTADRVATLEALAAGARYQPEPLLSPGEWAGIGGVCETPLTPRASG